MPVKTNFRCAGESHVGMLRQNNEDRVYLDPDRGIFLVIDGIGGQAAGEKAADIAIDRVRARLEARPKNASAKPLQWPTTKSCMRPPPTPSGTAWLAS